MVKLRRKAPFFCRAKSINGKAFIHLDGILTDADGELCPVHEKEAKERREAFFNKPIRPIEPAPDRLLQDVEWEARRAKGPIWPVDDEPSRAEAR